MKGSHGLQSLAKHGMHCTYLFALGRANIMYNINSSAHASEFDIVGQTLSRIMSFFVNRVYLYLVHVSKPTNSILQIILSIIADMPGK